MKMIGDQFYVDFDELKIHRKACGTQFGRRAGGGRGGGLGFSVFLFRGEGLGSRVLSSSSVYGGAGSLLALTFGTPEYSLLHLGGGGGEDWL